MDLKKIPPHTSQYDFVIKLREDVELFAEEFDVKKLAEVVKTANAYADHFGIDLDKEISC